MLALLAYRLWPTWEGASAQEKFARLIESHGAYAKALLTSLAHPGSVQPEALRGLQATARRTRGDAEAASARLADEPAGNRMRPELAQVLTATVSRLAHAELALHAFALSPGGQPPAKAIARIDHFASALDLAMSRIANALRTSRPEEVAPLRPIYTALAAELPRDAPLAALADRLVDATNTLATAVRWYQCVVHARRSSLATVKRSKG